jgi:hypothetical protein
MHKDFKDLLSAYARYAEPRTTKDLDLFIRPDPANASAVFAALNAFGAYLADATVVDFATPGTIFQIGVAPFRVDVICEIDGVTFEQAWETSEPALVDDEIPVRYISSDNLIANKLAAGRPQDLVDVDKLRHAAETKRRQPASPRRPKSS